MINLGDVNFALGADDRALRRSIQTMRQFGSTVTGVQTQVNNSANATAAAFRKQEAAATAALNKTLSLTQQFRKFEGTDRFVNQVTASFAQLNRQLTSGQLSALHYQRAMEQFRASTGNAVRGFKELTLAAQAGGKATGLWSGAMRVAQGSAVLWTGPLGGISTRISAFSSLLGDSTVKMALFAGGVVATVAVLYQMGKALLDAGKQINALQGQFEAVTGSLSQARELMDKVVKISRQTGQSVSVLGPAFAKFTIAADGTGLSMEQVEKSFITVAAAATKLQLSGEQTEGIFRALEQMMSKGTVQAEELRGQLGDRLAGAVQIAARAMGVTTSELQKMMKAGELITTDFLPKFTAELAKTLNIMDGKPIDNYTASLNNMATAWFQVRAELEKQVGVTNKVMNSFKGIATYLDGLRQVIKTFPELWAQVGDWAGVAAERILKAFQPTIAFFGSITKVVRDLWAQMFGGVGKDAAVTWAYVVKVVTDAINEVLDIITNLGEAIPVMLGTVTAAVASMTIDAVNTMIQKIVDGINWLSQKIGEAIPGMNTPITIKFDPIDNPFKDAFSAGSAEIKRIMEQEHDVLGDTQKAWEDYKKAVDEATRVRRGADRTKDDFIGDPFELDKAGQIDTSTTEMTEKEIKALARKQEAMKAINDELERTNEEIEALGGTDSILNSLNAQFKRDKEVEKYAKALRKAGVETAFITAKTQELAAALKLRDDLMKEREAILELRDTMADSFDAIGHGLVDALTSGEDGLKSFVQTLKRAVNDIIDTWLQLAVLNPLKNMLFGTDEPTLKGGLLDFSKALPGLFGGGGNNVSPIAETAGGFMGMLFGQGQGPNTQASSAKLLGGLGSPLGALKETSENFEGSMQAWMQSIKDIESSGGNYSALGPITKSGDRAYGAYQIMGNNVPSWSEKWVGQRMTGPEILGNKGVQDKMFAGQFGSYADKWGPERAANAWFTGSPGGKGTDILGTDSHGYVAKFRAAMEKNTAALGVGADRVGEMAKSAETASSSVGEFGTMLSQFPAAPAAFGGGAFGSGGGGMASLFGGGSGPAFTPWELDYFGGGLHPGLYRGGGIVQGGKGGRSVNPLAWLGAPSFGGGGTVGDEVPILAHRGERVLTKAQQRAGNDNGVNVSIHNYAGAEVKTESSRDSNGQVNLKIMVQKMVADAMTRPGTLVSNAMEVGYGLKPALNTR